MIIIAKSLIHLNTISLGIFIIWWIIKRHHLLLSRKTFRGYVVFFMILSAYYSISFKILTWAGMEHWYSVRQWFYHINFSLFCFIGMIWYRSVKLRITLLFIAGAFTFIEPFLPGPLFDGSLLWASYISSMGISVLLLLRHRKQPNMEFFLTAILAIVIAINGQNSYMAETKMYLQFLDSIRILGIVLLSLLLLMKVLYMINYGNQTRVH